MDDGARAQRRIEELEKEIERLRNPARALWSARDAVWDQIESTLRLGTWTWDVTTQAVDWSPNLFRILGYDPEVTPVSEAAKVFDEAIHPDDLEAYLAGQERALGGDTSQPTRFRFVRPDGRTLHALLLYTAVRGDEGQPTAFAGSIVDVTEQVEAETDLLQRGRLEAVGRLAGSVAHDFNNLLMVIQGNAELMLMDDPGNERLRHIQTAVDAGSSLTDQLLSFSRDRGQAPASLLLDTLVEETAPLLRRLLREDIEVGVELDGAGSLVLVDRGQFQAALVNLAVNARDAMPKGGKLMLRTRSGALPSREAQGSSEDAAVLCVEDAGVGMDAETLARAFEPFFTTKDGSRGPVGTGLGLASVQGFVRGAGGELRVRSEPGAGTSFELCFPRAVASEAGPPAPETGPARVPLTSEEILVVEDAREVRRVLAAGLKRVGLEPRTFANAEEAIEHWPELRDRVRVLITDVVMPGLSGRELATRLRRDRPELGVVFVTGYDPGGAPLEGSVVLGKPYTLAQLLEALRGVAPPGKPRSGAAT